MKSLVKLFRTCFGSSNGNQNDSSTNTIFRAYDQTGINVYEPSKTDAATYDGFKLHIGGSFRQGYQMLSHENVDTSNAKNLLCIHWAMVSTWQQPTLTLMFNWAMVSGFSLKTTWLKTPQ